MAPSLVGMSRPALALRRAKVAALQARRLFRWAGAPRQWPRAAPARTLDYPHLLDRREVSLTRRDPGADPVLESGKRRNVALAAPHFDGLSLGPRQPLSFWRALGRVSPARGFVLGAEVRGGCIVPTVGGGLCLLSNLLFRIACEGGWDILERHGHTMQTAPTPPDEPWGLDATVFWPHVDLRVAPPSPVRLSARVREDRLIVEVHGAEPRAPRVSLSAEGVETRGALRTGRVVRVIQEPDGRVARDVVATNRKRLLDPAGQRRNCLTCDEACHARPRNLAGPR